MDQESDNVVWQTDELRPKREDTHLILFSQFSAIAAALNAVCSKLQIANAHALQIEAWGLYAWPARKCSSLYSVRSLLTLTQSLDLVGCRPLRKHIMGPALDDAVVEQNISRTSRVWHVPADARDHSNLAIA